MRVNFYPYPGLQLGDVQIGRGDKAVRIPEIRLLPELGSVMAPKMMFSDAVASSVILPLEFIAGLPKVFEMAVSPSAKAGIRHFRFEKAGVSLAGFVLGGLEGEVTLTADGLFELLSLNTDDRSLKLEMKPLVQGLNVAVEAYGWRPSPKAALVFDSIALKARLINEVLAIESMDLRVFDGLIQGKSVIKTGAHPTVSGDIRFERINSTKLGEVLDVGQQFSGDVTGILRYSSAFDTWEKVLSSLGAEGDFVVRRGSIRGIDLPEAVRRVSGAPVQGGATVFEDLSGRLKFASGNWVFSGLVMNSGLMQSAGYLQISKDRNVSGRMALMMRGSVSKTQVPVTISGPLSSPTVKAVGR